jgi:hypothetical protein
VTRSVRVGTFGSLGDGPFRWRLGPEDPKDEHLEHPSGMRPAVHHFQIKLVVLKIRSYLGSLSAASGKSLRSLLQLESGDAPHDLAAARSDFIGFL